jgi:hypothetical protein
MQLPSDFTPEEYELFRFLTTGQDDQFDTTEIYQLLTDPIDKFLVCYIFEAKYTRKQAEKALGLSKATIWSKLKRIKATIYQYGKNKHLL